MRNWSQLPALQMSINDKSQTNKQTNMERTEKQIRDNKMGNKSQLWCPNLEMSRRINGVPRAKLHLIKPTYWVHSGHIEKTQKQRNKKQSNKQTVKKTNKASPNQANILGTFTAHSLRNWENAKAEKQQPQQKPNKLAKIGRCDSWKNNPHWLARETGRRWYCI